MTNVGIFYDYLCNNCIELEKVESEALKLHKNQQKLHLKLKKLHDLNPNSRELEYLSYFYERTLEFE